jgi:hypothetical protein
MDPPCISGVLFAASNHHPSPAPPREVSNLAYFARASVTQSKIQNQKLKIENAPGAMLVLGIQWLLEGALIDVSFDLYTYFLSHVRAYLPTSLSLGPEGVYPLVLIVMLGAVAAFFMPPIDPTQTAAEAVVRVKAERREVIVILTALLATLLWFSFGQQMTMLRAARTALPREEVRNLRLKYPIRLSHARANTVLGEWESHFDLYHHPIYVRKHAFTWRLEADYKVVSYNRMSETFLFRFWYYDDERR